MIKQFIIELQEAKNSLDAMIVIDPQLNYEELELELLGSLCYDKMQEADDILENKRDCGEE